VNKRHRPKDAAGSPSPLAGEGGERHGREPGEGSGSEIAKNPSPALATLGHPLPRGERVISQAERKICVARIGAAHGVRGAVKLWTFTEDPLAVNAYGPLSSRDGARSFEIAHLREAKDHLVATFKDITTRNEAERLNGIELYVPREKLPATEADEYYHADLIGLAAVTTADKPLGRVVAIHNFGAGDIIEIGPASGPTLLLPFSNAVVPTVDLAGGRVVIELPEEIEGDEPTAV
jgi:16S rRNA processing protein RimM